MEKEFSQVDLLMNNCNLVKHYTINHNDEINFHLDVEIFIPRLNDNDDSSTLLKLLRNIRTKIDKYYKINITVSFTI